MLILSGFQLHGPIDRCTVIGTRKPRSSNTFGYSYVLRLWVRKAGIISLSRAELSMEGGSIVHETPTCINRARHGLVNCNGCSVSLPGFTRSLHMQCRGPPALEDTSFCVRDPILREERVICASCKRLLPCIVSLHSVTVFSFPLWSLFQSTWYWLPGLPLCLSTVCYPS